MVAKAPAARARELPAGMRLGRYTLLRRIAHGGMAELYLASAEGAEGFRKLVALKLVLPHLADDMTLVSMLLDEARLAARLDHPNIAHVIDLGEADGEHYMAMEYVHGLDLRTVLADAFDAGGFPLECGLAVVIAACYGLDYAHELADDNGAHLSIVHRDVSPSNLIVRYDGCVKLVDFGIAKAAHRYSQTRTGMLKGKSGYMSPEQARGEPVDRRSDVFGLGILLYEATTSQRLFYGDNEFAVLNRIIDVEIEPPTEVMEGYPPELECIVLRALAPRPQDRFATARQMRAALDDFASARGLDTTPDRLGAYMRMRFGQPAAPEATIAELPTKGSGRARWAVAAVAAGALVGVGGFLAGRTVAVEEHKTESVAAARSDASEVESEPEPQPEPVAELESEPKPEPEPEPESPPSAEVVAEADPAPDASDDAPEPAPSKARGKKSKRRKRPKASSDDGRNLDAMMPRG